MVIIDGSFLIGVAAILTSVATLWQAARGEPWRNSCAPLQQPGEVRDEKLNGNSGGRSD